MLMTIDVGNTHISIGVFNGDALIATYRMITKTVKTSDEYGLFINDLLLLNGISRKDIDDVIISSVVPKVMYALNSSIIKYLNITPMIIGPGTKTGITVHTENPKEVGADRIVNAAAVYNIYKQSCLVIDFGTATTYDLVSEDGVLEYTIISPGIEISAQALWQQTAKLPEVEIVKPDTILTKNTIKGMQAGIVYGYIGQVEYIVNKLKEELSTDFMVISTGGLGRVFENQTNVIQKYDPQLAYYGMKIIYDKNRDSRK